LRIEHARSLRNNGACCVRTLGITNSFKFLAFIGYKAGMTHVVREFIWLGFSDALWALQIA
jgi:hypothetical protein